MLTSLEKWKKFSSAILYLFQIFLSFKVLQVPVQTSKTYPSKTECERKSSNNLLTNHRCALRGSQKISAFDYKQKGNHNSKSPKCTFKFVEVSRVDEYH